MRALLFALLLPTYASAQTLTTAILDASGVSDAQLKRVQRTAEANLTQLSALTVSEGAAFKKGAPRACEGNCAAQLASSLNAAGVLLLDVRGMDKTGEKISVELQLWLDGEKLGLRRLDGLTIDGFENASRAPLDLLLPAWAKKGYGGLRLQLEPGTTVKVDGRVAKVKPGQIQAVPAGMHQVDVIFPEGHAVLQRLEVPPGSRVKVEAQSPQAAVSGPAPKSFTALRGVSYGTFMAGAAVIAGGLIAGALGANTGKGLSSCQGDVRDCATLVEVQRRQAEAQADAQTGNIMLGVGGGLAAAGVAMFIIDAVTN